jgi:hypothetical protein
MMATARLESIGLVLGTVLALTFWCNYWVVPHDETRYAIMECMGEDSSKESYTVCRKQILENE